MLVGRQSSLSCESPDTPYFEKDETSERFLPDGKSGFSILSILDTTDKSSAGNAYKRSTMNPPNNTGLTDDGSLSIQTTFMNTSFAETGRPKKSRGRTTAPSRLNLLVVVFVVDITNQLSKCIKIFWFKIYSVKTRQPLWCVNKSRVFVMYTHKNLSFVMLSGNISGDILNIVVCLRVFGTFNLVLSYEMNLTQIQRLGLPDEPQRAKPVACFRRTCMSCFVKIVYHTFFTGKHQNKIVSSLQLFKTTSVQICVDPASPLTKNITISRTKLIRI
ncbi:hypothetical protein T265_08120 [Opisthorchis viverrini]|uniref:Uncharacterized protein n=1 Tax=Opisthorchis viverrini TaxID=6198 RepID=A0A075A9E9_OPIVI|nr:hypothetical protein T265_08120 [Opisthorchis viverrini]KER24134.1 hypothetical protein T265_08120 [Opisthorchis viverrini]